METVQKSAYLRYAWLLSKEAAGSREIRDLMQRVQENGGKWEQIFGGLLVIHMPKNTVIDAEAEMSRILAKFEL
ncbi:hypothetical protein D3C85_1748180 [compost metagenome]